jgi:DNA-directed RNA polymerase subunit L
MTNKNIDIKIVEQKKFDDTYNNYLILSFTGNILNNVIMNTLRRTIMELIPTYAFDKSDIDITKNTTIYNNDYMRLRLSHFPIIGIDNDIETINRFSELENEANLSTFEQKVEDINIIEEREQKNKLEKAINFTIYISTKNTTNIVMNLTTKDNDVKFYYKGKPIESPYKQELLIIKLKPGEEFKCTAISSLNIGLKGANYMPNAVCIFTEMENEYRLNIESLKQLTEIELIIRACIIINKKLDNFKRILNIKISEYKSEKYTDDFNIDSTTDTSIKSSSEELIEQHRVKGMITIENESHTYGNLLSRLFQDHSAISFAGYKIDHLLIKELTIGYKTDGTDILEILDDIIITGKNIFNEIKTKIEKLV